MDFSNSYLVPESGHPLEQEGRKRAREEEEEERRGSLVRRKEGEEEGVEEEGRKVKKREEEEERRLEKREVVLHPGPPAQGSHQQILKIITYLSKSSKSLPLKSSAN